MTRGLRFCMVTTFYPPYNLGGDGHAVQRLARSLLGCGHEVTVVHDVDAYHAVTGGGAPAGDREEDGVEIVALRSRLGVLSPVLTQQTGRPAVQGRALRALLESRGFDVIHYHNVSLVGGPGVLGYGNATKLYTAHEHWLVCPTHVLWRHGREACSGRECLRCTLRQARPPQLWRYTGLLERQAENIDAFIALSEFSREKHREMGFSRDMTVIPPFLPSRAAGPPETSEVAPHPRPYFLFVGRLERIKGLADVLPVFRDYPGADLLVAGEGADASRLREQAAGAASIHFLGLRSQPELRRYMRHAVALVVPSLGYETFGLVVIEAFREGTPVLARRLGPFPELVEGCGGGELFETREELRAALHRLQVEPGTRAAYARAALRGFQERWSEEVVLPRYLDLVQRLRDARTAGRARDPREEVEVCAES